MCLIIASEEGRMASDALLKQAYKDNPHGWGIMWADAGRIEVVKGFLFSTLERHLERANGFPYVLHFRYATHGLVNIKNCHPYKVTDGLWMAHNGIIHNVGNWKPSRSDSWHFARMLDTYINLYPEWAQSTKEFINWIEEYIGWMNKIAFLRTTGEILIANREMGEDEDGIWYSNTLSHPKKIWTPSGSLTVVEGRSAYPTWDGDDDDDEVRHVRYGTNSITSADTARWNEVAERIRFEEERFGIGGIERVWRDDRDTRVLVLKSMEQCEWCSAYTATLYHWDNSYLCAFCYQSELEYIDKALEGKTITLPSPDTPTPEKAWVEKLFERAQDEAAKAPPPPEETKEEKAWATIHKEIHSGGYRNPKCCPHCKKEIDIAHAHPGDSAWMIFHQELADANIKCACGHIVSEFPAESTDGDADDAATSASSAS